MRRGLADDRLGEVQQRAAGGGVQSRAVSRFEGVGPIADNSVAAALGVAGIAHVEGRGAQVAALGLVEEAGDAEEAAGPVALAGGEGQALDVRRGLGVLGAAGLVVVEVAEIR